VGFGGHHDGIIFIHNRGFLVRVLSKIRTLSRELGLSYGVYTHSADDPFHVVCIAFANGNFFPLRFPVLVIND
jgi:hypothetical protein